MVVQKNIISILILFFSINAFAKETLVFAVDIVRHGDRTSVLEIPKAPYKWAEGTGQLTALGMQQEFQLGTFLRNKYIHEYNLLPEYYQSGTMFVSSTDHDRTIVSAQAILFGLYPLGSGPLLPGADKSALPSGYQPIPVHIGLSIENEKLMFEKCAKVAKPYVISRPDWKDKDIRLKSKFKRWNLATGLNFTNVFQLVGLADTLYIYQLHHVPMPSELSKQDIEEIITVGQWGRITECKTKEFADFLGRSMLASVASYIQKASKHAGPLKYVLFSDHDITIACVMTLLQKPLDELVPYAANLNFALFKTDANNYLVKISYNGKSVVVPSCDAGGCTLKQFMKLAGHTQSGSKNG